MDKARQEALEALKSEWLEHFKNEWTKQFRGGTEESTPRMTR